MPDKYAKPLGLYWNIRKTSISSLTSDRPSIRVVTCRTIDQHALERNEVFEPAKLKACEAPHNDNDLVHYILVRGDLTIGQICAQVVHATGESLKQPHPAGGNTVAVVLKVDNQRHLLEYETKFKKANIPHTLISECDGEIMAIGLEPTTDRAKIRKVVSSLPLIK